MQPKYLITLVLVLTITGCTFDSQTEIGKTTITKWKDGKKAAISLTYDDGTINQFTIARPIMDDLSFPGTFYIITGKIKGAAKGKFIGRPIQEIIAETGNIPTDESNFFERASAIGFTGSNEAIDYHSRAGSLFESGKVNEAYQLIEEGYGKLRNGELIVSEEIIYHDNPTDTTTWEDLHSYAADGHEIASHTVTHPRLAVLDEVNLLYELEQSKADIAKYLGEEYTFNAECPYGTENERVMEYAYKIYPALRNRMPAPYLDELNRGSSKQPGTSGKEYVQWQRGPLTNVEMTTMKSWVDTCLVHDNIWLVLVFHGINGIGWEPRTGEELKEYFSYMKAHSDNLWIATFADVTKYIRERKSSNLIQKYENDKIQMELNCELENDVYNIPLTLKTYIPENWEIVHLVNENGETSNLTPMLDEEGKHVLYSLLPNSGKFMLIKGS